MNRDRSSWRHRARATLLAGAALLGAGCTRAAFGLANIGQAGPDGRASYAPGARHGIDVYRPATAGQAAPVVVFFYGGSWRNGARADYRFVGRRLADLGAVAMVADYRTYPDTTFPGFVEDGARAVAWARAHAQAWGGDPRCVVVAGHSAGAQIAALIATDPAYLAPHGLAPRDLGGAITLAGPLDFAITGDLVPVFGERSQWPRTQPLRFVDGNEPPFLLVHGLRDQVVHAEDSERMAARLQQAGVPTTLTLLPDGTHVTPLLGLYAPSRVPAVTAAITRFLATCGAQRHATR